MKNILNFLLEVGKLKGKARRGWLLHKIKNPETTAEHIFHLTLLVWLLGKEKKLNLERALKIALIHDLCEVYSPDFTSYDAKAIKENERLTIKKALKLKPVFGRPTTNQRKKLEEVKRKLERKAIKKLISKLPESLKREIWCLWRDYEEGGTKEARFVRQADRMINLLQGLDYWRKYGKIKYRLWVMRAKEVFDDPLLLELLKAIERKLIKKKK